MHPHARHERAGDAGNPTQTRGSHISAKRQIQSREQSPWCTAGCLQPVWAAQRKEPWPCLGSAGTALGYQEQRACLYRAIPREEWITLQYHKTHTNTAQFQPQPPAPSWEGQSLFPCCAPCCKEKQKGLKRSLSSKVQNIPSRSQMWWQTASWAFV